MHQEYPALVTRMGRLQLVLHHHMHHRLQHMHQEYPALVIRMGRLQLVLHHHMHHRLQEYSALAIRTGRPHPVLFHHTRPSRTSRFRRIVQPHLRRLRRTLSYQIHSRIIQLFRRSFLVLSRIQLMYRYQAH